MLYIFDLDGTLTPQRPSSTAPFERVLLPGVADKCAALRKAGHVLAIASNQGGARRDKPGRLTIGAIQAQMRWIRQQLGISAVRFAIGDSRKKPSPAMLVQLMSEFATDAADTVFVGDAETDRQAAEAAGVRFVWASEFFTTAAPLKPGRIRNDE